MNSPRLKFLQVAIAVMFLAGLGPAAAVTPLSATEKTAILAKSMKGLSKTRDEMEKVTFYEARGRNLLAPSLDAYIAVSDKAAPIPRVRAVYYGKDWVFYDKIKVMADNEIVYEKNFSRQDVARHNSGGSVWENADFPARPEDLAALQMIANSKVATIRFSSKERQQDHAISKKERARIAEVLNAYRSIATAINAR